MFDHMYQWLIEHRRLLIVALVAVIAAIVLLRLAQSLSWVLHPRSQTFFRFFQGDEETREELITTQQEPCPGAPFILPAQGYIGLFYGDPRGPYSRSQRHQGVDVFVTDVGAVPIYAAYDGYLSREPSWTSSVIMRIPDDPLNPGRQIWLYYTHMADLAGETSYIVDAFPRGTREVFVEQGTLIGYVGEYNGGTGARRISPHLHFSIVLDDGAGSYRNELQFHNTVDPSRYLGMAVNYACAPEVVGCTPNPLCEEAVLSYGGN